MPDFAERPGRGGRLAFRLFLASVLATVALVLGFVGALEYHGRDGTWVDALVVALQLFVLNASFNLGPKPWPLEVARLLAPLATSLTAATAALALLREQLQRARLRFARGHAVICGHTHGALQLARDFARHGERVVLVEAFFDNAERAGEEPAVDGVVLAGDPTDEELLRRARVPHARWLIAATADGYRNVEIALRARRLLEPPAARRTAPLECRVHLPDPGLCALAQRNQLLPASGDSIRIRVFNVYQQWARILLSEHPLDPCPFTAEDPRQLHLVVLGFGPMGESVVVQAAKIGHYANGKRLRITVLVGEAVRGDGGAAAPAKQESGFRARYPQIDQVVSPAFRALSAEAPETAAFLNEVVRDPLQALSVAVCLDDDTRALACALHLREALPGRDVEIRVQLGRDERVAGLFGATVAPSAHDDGASKGVQPPRPEPVPAPTSVAPRARLIVFGMVERFFRRSNLLEEDLDAVAEVIHAKYLAEQHRQGRPLGTSPTNRVWAELSESAKDGGRQQADHIRVKLRAVGRTTVAAGSPEAEPDFRFSPAEVELLARVEHARWCAWRYLEGWTYGPTRDDARKLHDCLVPYDELSEGMKQFDRDAVEEVPRYLQVVGLAVGRR
ncbi:MAG: NAD-binding protein [Planctomycetes bacterium]|nr:NAD-binding protein [Planctomycetota bacterium]